MSFINPFNYAMIREAMEREMVHTPVGYRSIILEALSRQYPMKVLCEYKEGDKSALVTCMVCENKFIVNYKLYIDEYKEWYCKQCGQRLVADKATTGVAHPKK